MAKSIKGETNDKRITYYEKTMLLNKQHRQI